VWGVGSIRKQTSNRGAVLPSPTLEPSVTELELKVVSSAEKNITDNVVRLV